jgi:uncharacterized protein
MDAQILNAIQFLQRQAASLLLYQAVLSDEVGQAFLNLLQSLQAGNAQTCLQAYGRWFTALASQQQDWQTHLLAQILRAENPFTQQAQQQPLAHIAPSLIAAARQDLNALQHLYNCNDQQLSHWVQVSTGLEAQPVFWQANGAIAPVQPIQQKLAETNWAEALEALAQHYREAGVGLFASARAFRWQAGKLWCITHPDPVRLDQLVGYETQRDQLLQNTEALLVGYPALHVLLYGSRGSGKSSLVKSLLHRYGDRGLRLIEVAKSDLKDLTIIVEQLRVVPQKFIIFVDDLSFEEDDDAFKALKVVLEGNLTARPQNVVVYATSNRRHLIREFFADRPRPNDADEVHAWDTVQEKLSFGDRFGLTLTFEPADQKTYLAIAHHLAQLANIPLSASEIERRALQWATRHNGRSGRTARQFVDFLQAELALPSRS